MRKQFKNICIDRDVINYGEKCNIITFSEGLFNEYQLSALSKQYEKLGFLKCASKYNDDNVDIYYYTTNLTSISQYFSQGNINKTEFVSIIKTICQSIKLCSNYAYFHKNNLILDEELIYIDSKDKSVHIMYVPTSNFITDDTTQDIKRVIINLINNHLIINSGQESFTQEILEGLRHDNLTIDEIMSFLDNAINKSHKAEKKVKTVVEPIKVQEFKPESFTYNMDDKNKNNENQNKGIKGFFKSLFSSNGGDQSYPNVKNYNSSTYDQKISNGGFNNKQMNPSAQYGGFGDNCDDTMILGVNQLSTAYLLPSNDDFAKEVIINKDSFIIGRLKSVVDYEVTNKTVGKTHAKFIRQENKFYLVDLESKNGTYINSTKLQPNSLYEVENGDSVVFSNERYTFIIEE